MPENMAKNEPILTIGRLFYTVFYIMGFDRIDTGV
ncbi:MAG: hypothetical protein ACD_13C00251G0010 [uncultured bacterium]|nr:MAG: hypothetical protein ACD_13C00251G0010 [uncultured bacterium]